MNVLKGRVTNKQKGIAILFLVCVLAIILLVNPVINRVTVPSAIQEAFTLGAQPVSAAGVADSTADGTDDNVNLTTLTNALPATGGRISILTGTYAWAALANVTRAIPNVTIDGTGYGTYIDSDGVTAPITAGGNNWVISNMRFDAPGPNMGATTGWIWNNVWVGATHYDYRNPTNSVIAGTVTSTTVGATTLNAPTGRGATYVIAASDATATEKAQADVVCDGTADEVEIDSGIVAGYKNIYLSTGTFHFTVNPISVTTNSDNINITGSGDATIFDVTALGAVKCFYFYGNITVTTSNLAANAIIGSNTITLVAGQGANYSPGDWLRIKSDGLFSLSTAKRAEICQIISILGDVLTIDHNLFDTYNVASSASIEKLIMRHNIHLSNFQIIGTNGNSTSGIWFDYCTDTYVNNIKMTDVSLYGVENINVINGNVTNCKFTRVNEATALATGLGLDTRDVKITNNQYDHCRQAAAWCSSPTNIGVQRNIIISNNTVESGTQIGTRAFEGYPEGQNIVVSNNVVLNQGLALIDGLNMQVISNTMNNPSVESGVVFEATALKCILSNNTIIGAGDSQGLVEVRGGGSGRGHIINGNTIISSYNTALFIKTDGVLVSNNNIQVLSTGEAVARAIIISQVSATSHYYDIAIQNNTIYCGVDLREAIAISITNIKSIYGLMIQNNTIRDSYYGIHTTTSSTGKLIECCITSNIIRNTYNGIYFDNNSIDGANVENNTVYITTDKALSTRTGVINVRFINNSLTGGYTEAWRNDSGSITNKAIGNTGYIASGEVRTTSGSLQKTAATTLTTVTGTFTESVAALKPGVNTLHCTVNGTANVVIPTGSTAIAASVGGGATVANSPKACPVGTTLITVTAGGTNEFTVTVTPIAFSWHNPEAQDIFIKKVVVNITTKGGTATSVIDAGIADDAVYTNGGVEFFDDIDADAAAAVHDSYIAGDGGAQTKWVLCQDSASATDGWVTAKIFTEIADALVGSYYIEYVGK